MGMRWRTEAEVSAGTGQFSCGARKCGERRGLASFEVPFAYTEAGLDKQALVKVRPACAACSVSCALEPVLALILEGTAGAPVPRACAAADVPEARAAAARLGCGGCQGQPQAAAQREPARS